jgi:hypothetical protein
MSETPLVYLILGASGSGRREIVVDLIEGGMPEGSRALSLLAEGETPDPADAKLAAVSTVATWRWTEGKEIDAEVAAGADKIFFFAHGRQNPVDQIEAFKLWREESQPGELARILTVVNCQLAELHPPLLAWYDACVHFSDVLLLNRREGVANKWISDFQARYKDQFFPCVVELVRGGKVRNPVLILEPLPLRVSHAFENEADWVAIDGSDAEGGDESEDEVELEQAEDPYFARFDSGRRLKEIPRIDKFI